MDFNNQKTTNEIKEDIEYRVWQLEGQKDSPEFPSENIVHQWPKHVYAHTRYGSKEALHIGITLEYDKNSKTFGASVRTEIDEYSEGSPIENVRNLKDYQGLSMEDAIKIGSEVDKRLALEMTDLQKNTLEKTQTKLDKNQKAYDPQIEI